jgi:nucleotide-binding universal stress UspA family protein
MNTRGLMELIVLNIGYDLGVLSAELFSMMVVMALVTTFMTGPSLDLINFLYRPKKSLLQEDLQDKSKFKILLSFAKSNTGISLLYLADALTLKSKKNAEITALHIEPANELHHYEVETQELDSFREIKQVAQQLEQPIQTVFKISSDIDSEIVQTSNERNQDLLLLGVSESIYEGSLLGRFLDFTTRIVNPEKLFHTVTNAESPFMTFDRNQQINAKVNAMVGILIDKDFVKAKRVIVPVVLKNDEFLCEMIKRLIQHSDAQIIVWDLNQVLKTNESFKEKLRQLEQLVPNHLTITEKELNSDTWQDQDLMLISLPSWNKIVNKKVHWLPFTPSTLLMADRKP